MWNKKGIMAAWNRCAEYYMFALDDEDKRAAGECYNNTKKNQKKIYELLVKEFERTIIEKVGEHFRPIIE